MKTIEINKVQFSDDGKVLYPAAANAIAVDNWNYPAEMDVHFGMAYDEDHFYLSYKVIEDHPKAICTTTNGPVWEDSCVEFFIAFSDEGYYNLEFNCIGTKLTGFGTSNKDREWLKEEVVNTIVTTPSLGTQVIDKVNSPGEWTLNVRIPKAIFVHNEVKLEKGETFKVNFYKCGDKQKDVHFLSWNAIDHPTPNFHLPAFFGELKLV